MTRTCCQRCGTLRWSELPVVFDGADPDNVFHGLELRNAPCGSTLAEPAGIAFAASVVRPAAVHIEEVPCG